MNDALACEGLGEHTDHEAEHGGTTVEPLNLAELLVVNRASGTVLEPLVAGLLVVHAQLATVEDCNGS